MTIAEFRVTEHLPKLVEAGARNCYNSFDLSKPDGHNLVKKLMFMPNPHLSIGHHGNILICLETPDLPVKQLKNFDRDLHILLQSLILGSNGYLTATTKEYEPESQYEAVVSGNIVAWKNALNYVIDNQVINYSGTVYNLVEEIIDKLNDVPETTFFMTKEEGYALMDNPYVKKHKDFISSDKRNEILAIDNFGDILTEKERMKHETATVVMRTSRDMSMQYNRHDAGISQLSQRYVLPFDLEGTSFKDFVANLTQEDYNDIPFKFHIPDGIDPDEDINLYLERLSDYGFGDPYKHIDFDTNSLLWNGKMTYNQMMEVMKTFFFSIFFHMYPEREMMHKRANEIARSILPNSMETVVYYTRPRWKWEHLISLRTSAHTQFEARREAIPLLLKFHTQGWFNGYTINMDKLTARKKVEETQNEK